MAEQWTVTCLCADWCDACRAYRIAFASVATKFPELRFDWVDIEDQADRIGDIDIETFPTILVAEGQIARFFGPLVPHSEVLERLVASLQSALPSPKSDPSAQALAMRLAAPI